MFFGGPAFTGIHVAISLVGILSGFVVLFAMLSGRRPVGWTALFLAATLAASVTGFLFPFHAFLPSHAVGTVSLAVLALAIYAFYSRRLAGGWRRTYVITSALAQYLNVFVLVVQSFEKAPALRALAPTQSEPPFLAAQLLVLALFVVLTVAADRRFRNVS
jgi:hypothetical protein